MPCPIRPLDFSNCDGLVLTYFNAAFTSEALFRIHWFRFAVHQFIDIHRAHLNTFFTPFTLVFVNHYFVTHILTLLSK
ncbi:hypothetical protein PITCH_A220023 [uncultured Desulfobacterium sp.]|uniref:Uncharacterized protein n=1 Tax=uncultured Desulfobacterium sp. TaxID=201089 RepID=A0A445MXN6_9BACT|nr:hypothetical protein PITCH_A220023 [uncultured Desulfobacterium sp.]